MKTSTSLVAALLLAAIPITSYSQSSSSSKKKYVETKEHQFTMDKDYAFSVRVNEQHTKLALAIPDGNDKETNIFWGTESYVVKMMAVLQMFIDPTGKRLALIGIDKKGNRHVVVDGVEVGKYKFIFYDALTFSADGSRYAFAVSKSGKAGKDDKRVISDGKKGDKFSSIVGPAPAFSPDSKRLVYFARKGNDRFVVDNGVKGPKFNQTGWGPYFSADSKRVVYVGITGDGYYLIDNDKRFGPFPEVRDVSFAPNSNDLVYVVKYKDSSRVFFNHIPYEGDYKYAYGITFSSDGKRFAFVASDGISNQFLVIDSVQHRQSPGELVSTAFFTDDSRHYYYDVATDNTLNSRRIVVDDSVVWSLDTINKILEVSISPDGERVGIVWDSDSINFNCVVDSNQYYGKNWSGKVAFSDDSRHFAVVLGNGKEWQGRIIVDGEEIPKYDIVYPGITFTSDSQHIIFATKSEGKEFIVIGDQELTHYDEIYPKNMKLNEDGNLTYFGLDNRTMYRVTVNLVN